MDNIAEAAKLIRESHYMTVFTGAGISKESGIPVFRGDEGVYSHYDSSLLELDSYLHNTAESWKAVKAIFYDFFAEAYPNAAHKILAKWEGQGIVKAIVTQNIDNLHQEGGCKDVIEFHGTKDSFKCLTCGRRYRLRELQLTDEPPTCGQCGGLLKPEFIFFGEGIPTIAYQRSFEEAMKSDVHLVIGTTGDVQPAASVPCYAKRAGAKIIEINPEPSAFTNNITDVYIDLKAVEAMTLIDKEMSAK